MAWNRTGKFNNKKCTIDNVQYDSRAEASFGQTLELRKKAGEIKKIERQIMVDVITYGKKVGYCRIDFLVTYANGEKWYEEVKGGFQDRTQMLKYKILGLQLAHEKNKIGFKIVFSTGQEKIYYKAK